MTLILSFFLFSFLLNNYIKEQENHNIAVKYSFGADYMIFLKEEEEKLKNAIKISSGLGYNITSQTWVFAKDGFAMPLEKLYNSINPNNLHNIVNSDKKNLSPNLNSNKQNVITSSTKTMDKATQSITIYYSFSNKLDLEAFFKNLFLIKKFIDEALYFETVQILNLNNNLVNSINKHINNFKEFCKVFNLNKDLIDINLLDKNFMSESTIKITEDYIKSNSAVSNFCDDPKLPDYRSIKITNIFNQKESENIYSIKDNQIYLDYTLISKSDTFNYNLFIFMISLSFTIFLIMIYIRLTSSNYEK